MIKTLLGAVALGTLVLGACSADETDFKAAAEKGIKGNVEDVIEGDASVSCTDPGSTDVGTTFDCEATAGDGSVSSWTAEITGEKEVSYAPVGFETDDATIDETEDSTGS